MVSTFRIIHTQGDRRLATEGIHTSRRAAAAVVLAYIAFISLGLPDGLLGIAWPSIRHHFSRSLDSLGILLMSSTTGYLLSSFFSGPLLARLGVGWLLSASCAATGAGLIGYTVVSSWWMMIPLAAVAGLGAGAIDAGINAYVARHFSERVMQWLHASFGIGITSGPIIMTSGLQLFGSWKWGYVVVGSAQLALAVCFALTRAMWRANTPDRPEKETPHDVKPRSVLGEAIRRPIVWFSMLMFFLYTGLEASVGIWTYTLLTESRGVPTAIAGLWSGSYWATFTVGRIAAGFFTKHVPIDTLIRICLAAAALGAALLLWNPFAFSALAGVVIIGFAVAPIFPGMMSLTSLRVGSHIAPTAIGMQVSAAGLGVAVVPGLLGYVAQRASLELIPLLILGGFSVLLGLYLSTARAVR